MKYVSYNILGYLAIAYTGIHFFSGSAIMKALFVAMLIIIFGVNQFENVRFVGILFIFSSLIVLQHVLTGETEFSELIGAVSIMVIIPYTLTVVMGLNFPKYYVKALYFICIVSLPLYVLSAISPGFFELLAQIPKSYPMLDPNKYWDHQFIIFSTNPSYDPYLGILRNSGAFHEPGVFVMFLTIGIFFNYIINENLFNRAGVLFLVCAITTFSTAGYLAISVLLIGILLNYKKYTILKYLMIPVSLVLFFQFVLNNPLMVPKVRMEYNLAMKRNIHKYHGGRFFGARRALYVIKEYPVTGKGLLPSAREENPNSIEFVQYGILSEITKMGLVVTAIYLFFLWKGVRNISEYYENNKLSVFFFAAILVNLFSQSFSLSVVTLIIVFTGIESNQLNIGYETETQD